MEEEQLSRVAQFLLSKCQNLEKVVGADFTDAEGLLHGDEYTGEEIQEHFENLKSIVGDTLNSEHKHFVDIIMALVNHMVQDAGDQGARIEVDLHTLEDGATIQEVEHLREVKTLPKATPPRAGRSQLTSIRDEHSNVIRENHRLQEQVEELQDRVKRLQSHSSQAQRERSALANQVDDLRYQMRDQESKADEYAQAKDADFDATRSELADAKNMYNARTKETVDLMREVDDLKAQLRAEQEANKTRLNQSKQVQQMRKMMSQKNETIASLRKKLEHYEPDALQADDDF